MTRTLLPALAAFILTLTMTSIVKAEASEHAIEPATVVIYRADESSSTKRLRFGLLANDAMLGRIQADNSIQAQLPAGTYTLHTTLPGAEPLTVELKPGAIHFVHTSLTILGNNVQAELLEVEEELARSHGATDFDTTI